MCRYGEWRESTPAHGNESGTERNRIEDQRGGNAERASCVWGHHANKAAVATGKWPAGAPTQSSAM
ncbi:MAG: hypothetical protein RJB61_2426 [Actinomycetota bacterium]